MSSMHHQHHHQPVNIDTIELYHKIILATNKQGIRDQAMVRRERHIPVHVTSWRVA